MHFFIVARHGTATLFSHAVKCESIHQFLTYTPSNINRNITYNHGVSFSNYEHHLSSDIRNLLQLKRSQPI